MLYFSRGYIWRIRQKLVTKVHGGVVQNTNVKNSELLGKMHKYRKIAALVLLLLLISLASGVAIYKGYGKNLDSGANKGNTTSTPTPQSQPNIPTTQATPTVGKSYGIFYPFGEGVTINNNTPTIIGKVAQDSDLYLETKFGVEKSSVSGKDEYFLRFVPGKVKNLKVKIDNTEIKPIFGIPQYPTVLCKKTNLNPDRTSSYDPKTGLKSPPDDIFDSESNCLSNKRSELPPLIFFAKIKTPLPKGKHILTLEEGKDNYPIMSFLLDPDYHLTTQDIYVIDKTSEFYFLNQYPLIAGNNCSEGYYYDSNYLKIPLPTFNNPNLYYGISFPHSQSDLEDLQKRRVQIAFGNERFDLFFPQSSIFYEGKSFFDQNRL